MIDNKTWCPLPWVGLNVRNNGDVRVCCNANTSKNQGLPVKPSGEYYNLGRDGIRSHLNSELMKDIRVAMLANEYHSSCLRCQREDDAGMDSRKEWEKRIWADHIDLESARKLTEADGTIPDDIPIKYADLRFGNLCNLKCRMCGPTDSSQWYDDQAAVWGTSSYTDSGIKINLVKNENGKLKPDVDIYSWYENQNFWTDLEKEIPNLTRIYVVGGEPLLIDQHYDFLNKCIQQGRAKDILVEYNSNITNIPKRAWDIWKHFQKIQMGVSADGFGKINDYIRHPSNWKQIEANLRKLDTADGDFKVWIASTIMVYNMVHLPEFILWKVKQNYKNINSVTSVTDRPTITPHPLHNPNFLNIKIFPAASKLYIENYFNECKIKYREEMLNPVNYSNQTPYREHIPMLTYTHFCKVLDNYIKYMYADDWSHLLPKFWQYTDGLDALRGESLREVSPITWDLLKGN